MRYILSLALLFIGSSFAIAQPKCIISLLDGSRIYGTIADQDLEITTKYGKMVIPWEEVKNVKFGLHFPAGVKQEIDMSIKKLTSLIYKEREEGQAKLFKLGRHSYLTVSDHAAKKDSKDLEFIRRTELIKKKIEEEIPDTEIRKVDHDFVISKDATLKGTLSKGSIKVKTAHLGEVDLKLCTIDSLLLNIATGAFTLDASKYALKPIQWYDTGFMINESHKWIITAKGTVDLWPQTPNQYVASPKGLAANLTTDGWPAGGLIGKIGENGKEFLISERYVSGSSFLQDASGKLYLRINSSPWQNGLAPLGSYEVKLDNEK